MKRTILTLVFTLSYLVMVNGQCDWKELASGLLPVDYKVWSISIVDENIVWATASTLSRIDNRPPLNHLIKVLKTIDGGQSWESYDVVAAEGRISFDIEALDEEIAFLTSNELGNGQGRGLMRTTNGGDTWDEILLDRAGGVWIQMFNELEGLVINRGHIAVTKDGGDTWDKLEGSEIPEFLDDEYTIIISGNNSCQSLGNITWFGTNKGRIFRSIDKGNSWEIFETPAFPNRRIYNVAFTDTMTGLARMNNINGITELLRTNDGGKTWEEFDPGLLAITDLSASAHSKNHFVGTSGSSISDNNFKMFASSTDNGVSWVRKPNELRHSATQFYNENLGWSGNYGITPFHPTAMYKYECTTTNTQDLSGNTIMVYPNPAHDVLYIESNIDLKTLLLFDMHGRKVVDKDYNYSRLNLEGISSGVYILRLEFEDRISTHKVVIE